jgi:glucosamine 6-phosphate synthetase-like amidotransferase/phosphosugar isomerase protein
MSLAPGRELDTSGLLRLLAAGMGERGRDASGFAYPGADGTVCVVKDSQPLARFLDRIAVPAGARAAVVHVREFTKGIPGLNDNNHPIRHGRVVGVHNGHLDNDDELFERFGRPRSTPEITVDSEAIMMLTDLLGDLGEALELVQGAATAAVLRDGEPDRVSLARRATRPLFVAEGDGVVAFASTVFALRLVNQVLAEPLRIEAVDEGVLLELRDGTVVSRGRFEVDARHRGRAFDYADTPEKGLLVRRALRSLAPAAGRLAA